MVGCLTGPQGFTLGWDVRPRWGRRAGMCVPVGDAGLGCASPLGTPGWDVRPCWGRAVHNGEKVSNGNQDVTVNWLRGPITN